jgi:hypothetical protein
MAKRRPSKSIEVRHYDQSAIVDAPEHHEYSRAMGILTWSTWDHGVRPFAQRVAEFVSTYPPTNPVKCVPGGSLLPTDKGSSFAPPGTTQSRLDRFLATDWRPGSIYELLSRYGLKIAAATAVQSRPFEPGTIRDTTRKRNIRLRVLHGGVDIEPENMDAAKAEYLDRQESKRAAQDVRDALKRMKDELVDGDGSHKP